MKFTKLHKDLIAISWINYYLDPDTDLVLKGQLPEPDYIKKLSKGGWEWPTNKNPETVLSDLIYDDPDLAYEITLKIIELTEDKWLLTLIATGSLESLVKYHAQHKHYLNLYNELAKNDDKHKFVLSQVWL